MANNSRDDLKVTTKLSFLVSFNFLSMDNFLYDRHPLNEHKNKKRKQVDILTDKRNATQNQSCCIQAVISSKYVEINQQKMLTVSCFEGISNFV